MTQTEQPILTARRKVVEIFAGPTITPKHEHGRSATPAKSAAAKPFYKTKLGTIYLGDSLAVLSSHVKPKSVDLIMTSPPFGLVRKKDYGNVESQQYLVWFR